MYTLHYAAYAIDGVGVPGIMVSADGMSVILELRFIILITFSAVQPERDVLLHLAHPSRIIEKIDIGTTDFCLGRYDFLTVNLLGLLLLARDLLGCLSPRSILSMGGTNSFSR